MGDFAKDTDVLISRQAAIDEIHKYFLSEMDKEETKTEDGWEVYADTPHVNELLTHNKHICTKIKALPSAEPKWIPVTEQTLPKRNSVVVVCGKKGTWDFGTYRGHTTTNINFWNWKKNTLKEVYWWMYKEDALADPVERRERCD